MKNKIGKLAVLAMTLLPAAVFAQSTAYVQGQATLYAGPGEDYPVLGEVYPGRSLILYGCLNELSWCDVSTNFARGWIPGDALEINSGGRTIYLQENPSYAPIVFFDLGTYWGLHYHSRPWYNTWHNYRFHPRPAPVHRWPHHQGSFDHHGPGNTNHGSQEHHYPSHNYPSHNYPSHDSHGHDSQTHRFESNRSESSEHPSSSHRLNHSNSTFSSQHSKNSVSQSPVSKDERKPSSHQHPSHKTNEKHD